MAIKKFETILGETEPGAIRSSTQLIPAGPFMFTKRVNQPSKRWRWRRRRQRRLGKPELYILRQLNWWVVSFNLPKPNGLKDGCWNKKKPARGKPKPVIVNKEEPLLSAGCSSVLYKHTQTHPKRSPGRYLSSLVDDKNERQHMTVVIGFTGL